MQFSVVMPIHNEEEFLAIAYQVFTGLSQTKLFCCLTDARMEVMHACCARRDWKFEQEVKQDAALTCAYIPTSSSRKR